MIEPSTRLRRAIVLDDAVLVQRLVVSYPKVVHNPDFEDKANTSLHLVAKLGYAKIAAILISAGHDSKDISRNTDHETPLMLATRHGRIEVATLLIKTFPQSVHLTNKDGMDALALSCQNSASTPLVSTLLSLPDPASPNSKDLEGNTPMHHASAAGSLKALRILLSAGGDPLAKNNQQWTPLAFSCTVASEVYFRNLIAEYERKKVEGLKLGEERERQRVAGLRMIDTTEIDPDKIGIAVTEDDMVMDDADGAVLPSRPSVWSPEKRRPATPVQSFSVNRSEFGTPTRSRAGSGD